MIITIGKWTITDEAVITQSEYDEPLYTDETMSITDVYKVAKKYCDNVYIQDGEYVCPEKENICKFIDVNGVSDKKYVPDKYDCENYAIELLADVLGHYGNIPFGMAKIKNTETKSGHRLNCAIIDGTWYWIEPQSDELYTELDEKYEVVFITI